MSHFAQVPPSPCSLFHRPLLRSGGIVCAVACALSVLVPIPASALTYDRCVAKVNKSPARALRTAEAWARRSKTPAADHCVAIALSALGRYDEAATRIKTLIKGARTDDEAIALYDQLGLLRLDQGRADLAVESYSKGLGRFGKSLPLLTGRARAYAARQQWPKVVHDLTIALSIAPDDPRILFLDAAALRRGGQPDKARFLIERALSVAPAAPELLLERGNIRWDLHDDKGAVADWTRVTEVVHSGATYDAAKRDLDSFQKAGQKAGQ